MTNDEKASQIARELVNDGIRGKYDIAKKAAVYMAKWKDSQDNSKIDSLINFIIDYCWEHPHDKGVLQIEGFDGLDDFIEKLEEITK